MTNDANSSAAPWLNAIGSRYFLDWLQQQRCSLAFTTYQTGRLQSTDGMNLSLSGLTVAMLTGGLGDNSFNVGDWTGTGKLSGKEVLVTTC